MNSRSFSGQHGLVVLALLLSAAAPAWAGKVSISSLPVMSSPVLVADNTTPYTVTLTASGAAGYNDITSVRVLFNITESDGDPSRGRGYLAWGQADSHITNYGGTWVFADASGGGRWGYETSPWDSTPYITPISCSVSTAGNATGGTGTRTVTFTFTVKSAWANNPLINDADAWAMTANDGPNESDYCKVGWIDNPEDFIVVPASCTQQATAPAAPMISNPTPHSLDLAINPADSGTDLFAIRVSPPVVSQTALIFQHHYVQANGTIGAAPVWQTKAAWGTRTVTGLSSDTDYTFEVRAFNNAAGTCPSAWGPPATGTTAPASHLIDCSASGVTIHSGVDGMAHLPWNLSSRLLADILAASINTTVRFGGDGYNWKTRTAEWASGPMSTLQFLRNVRDRNSHLQILTNTRGIGTGNGSTWVYTDQTPQTLAALTADWVYYCNVLVQTKRQGDPLTTREQALLDSLDWGTDDKLLAPGEAMVPKVTWWEVGNEPEGPFPPPALSPSDYANRYRIISAAMLAEDPTIKVGPGCMTANNGNAWLDAVFANKANQVDFVSYHPYGNLYGITRDQTGGILDPAQLMKGLNVQKELQQFSKDKIVERLVANNRPANTKLITSEWNPSSWQGTYYYTLSQTVAQGLGIAENIFSFIEMGIFASQYWDQPNYPSASGIEVPQFQVFKALQAYLPDRMVDSYSDGYFRLYTTRDSGYQQIILWALNLSETDDKQIEIGLGALPAPLTILSITQRKLAALSGETSLTMKNALPATIGWTETDLTGQIDPAGFTATFDNATLTMLIFDVAGNDAPIVVDPAAFSHTIRFGQAVSDDVFGVASGGTGTLNYNIDDDADWLTVSPTSGVSVGEPQPVTITYHTAGLAPGEYTATITIASDDAYNSPQAVIVTLSVQTVKADYDKDGDVDQEDFSRLQRCLGGLVTPECAEVELTGNQLVDQADVARFVDCLSAPGIAPLAQCAP